MGEIMRAVFDWTQAAKQNDKDELALLRELHTQVVDEGAFITRWTNLPWEEGRLHRSRHRSTAHARQQYRNLKTKFGFFTGELQ